MTSDANTETIDAAAKREEEKRWVERFPGVEGAQERAFEIEEETGKVDEQTWLQQCFVVRCSKGLHMRPASAIAKLARGFDAEIILSANQVEASATSLMKVIQLEATTGTEIQVRCRGPEAAQALHAIGQQIQHIPPEES